MLPRGVIVPLGRGDRRVTDSALDRLTGRSGLVGRGDHRGAGHVREGLAVDSGLPGIPVEKPVQLAAGERRARFAVQNGLKEKRLRVVAVQRPIEVFPDRGRAFQVDRHGMCLVALDRHVQNREFGVIGEISHLEPGRLRTARTDIEEDVQQRAVAQPLQPGCIRRVEHGAHLASGEGGGLASADPGIAAFRSAHAGDRVRGRELRVGQMLVKR